MTHINEIRAARINKSIAAAQELIDAGFCTKAAQSRAMSELNRAYENAQETIHWLVIEYARERVPAWDQGGDHTDVNWIEYRSIIDAYELPYNLAQVRPVHVERAAIHSVELASTIEALVALRSVAKATPVVPQPKDETKVRIAAIRASIIETMERRKVQFVEALDVAREFNGLRGVSCNCHWVRHEQGTMFLRWYFYLNGRVTPLQVLIAAADAHAREQAAAAA